MIFDFKREGQGCIFVTLAPLFMFLNVFLFPCRECLSWQTFMHKDITRIAYDNLPIELKEALSPYKDSILWNSMVPDLILQDWPHHEWNVHRKPRDETDGPEYVQLLSKELISCLRENCCAMEEVARTLGRIAHYIEDLNQPLHTDDYLNDNDWIHLLYEFDLYQDRDFLHFSYKGSEFWDDIDIKAMESAARANRYYAPIVQEYQNGNGLDSLKTISQTCYANAVQDVIDLWSTVWFAAKAKEPVRLAIAASRSRYFPGDLMDFSISAIVTRPCFRGDLYVTITDKEGMVWYLTQDGERLQEPVPIKSGWKPKTRLEPFVFSVPANPELTGESFTVSAFTTILDGIPWSYGTMTSNVSRVRLEISFTP